ncbi:MAG: AAA family ATPase [Burkholderiales bacterium]|nr:AAA family ATPase [Burkholderiales bacterium]
MTPDAPTDPAASLALVHALRRRLQARHGEVALIETHISWVLLAGAHAFKLKKPLRLDFLDFSTLARRRAACADELRLNRRLAPAIYLGLAPIRAGARGPSLYGRGPVVEWAVKMRRFAPRALASERLADGRLAADDLARFGRRLAAFHARAAVAPPGSDWGSAERVRSAALQAAASLSARIGEARGATLHEWLDAQARRLHAHWRVRQDGARVREGHGDLHLDNLVWTDDALVAFDCLEFDPALRWIDVMSDAGFLLMDLMARGRADLGFAFLDAWLEHGGDHGGLVGLRFHLVYRATVRALVTALRGSAAPGAPDLEAYLSLAQALMTPARPALLITHGLPASGKSWLARELLQRAQAIRLRSDVERKRLAGLAPLADSRAAGDLYTAASTQATYEHLATRARAILAAGWPVIVDAAFLRREERTRFARLAAEAGARFAILDCRAPMAVLRARIAARRARADDASEADESVLVRLAALQEPLAEAESQSTIRVRTDAAIDLDAVLDAWLGPGARPSSASSDRDAD